MESRSAIAKSYYIKAIFIAPQEIVNNHENTKQKQWNLNIFMC